MHWLALMMLLPFGLVALLCGAIWLWRRKSRKRILKLVLPTKHKRRNFAKSKRRKQHADQSLEE
jgi:hypothetical protein